ncbi:MAG: hypothetical protein HY291_09210 [Planctomycetes bacterium]|nr:hypothetical protein [Planctomycetota bacterium]
MQLDWFRQHHKKVFWVIAIVVIPTFIIWSPTGKTTGDAGGITSGPAGDYYHVDGRKQKVDWDEIVSRRKEYSKWLPRGYGINGEKGVNGEGALRTMVRNQLVQEFEFDVGPNELKENLQAIIRSTTGKPIVNEELIERYLSERGLSQPQFERLGYEDQIFFKYLRMVAEQVRVPDTQLFVEYCMEKQTARLLYKEFKSKDFIAKVDKPKPEEIKEFYEKYKADYEKNKEQVQDDSSVWILTKPKLMADVFYLASKDIEPQIKPTEDDLKSFYELYKIVLWKKDPKKGPDPDNLKKYDEVKEDVRKEYVRKNLPVEKEKLLTKFREEFRTAEAKAEAAKHTFDVAKFAKDHGLTYWRTKPLTIEEYRKGAEKAEAPDFKYVERLFGMATPDKEAESEKIKAFIRKQLQPDFPIGKDADEAYVMLRIPADGYQAARTMSLEEATPEATSRLIERSAVEKAQKAAEEIHDQWAKGENLPKPADLKDEVFSSQSKNRLALEYFNDPKAIGEVLKPSIDIDPDEDRDNPKHFVVRIGFAVDRKLPTWQDFEQDFSVSREQQRKMLEYDARQFMQNAAVEFPNKLGRPKIDDKIPDQPLYREVRSRTPSDS